MLLKFTTPDLLDSTLVDPSTNTTQYIILTRPHFIHPSEPKSDASSDCTLDSEDGKEARRTFFLDSTRTKVLAEIGWVGLQPTDIVIGNERLENVKELFGCIGSLMSYVSFCWLSPFLWDYELIVDLDPRHLECRRGSRRICIGWRRLNHWRFVFAVISWDYISSNGYLTSSMTPTRTDQKANYITQTSSSPQNSLPHHLYSLAPTTSSSSHNL